MKSLRCPSSEAPLVSVIYQEDRVDRLLGPVSVLPF